MDPIIHLQLPLTSYLALAHNAQPKSGVQAAAGWQLSTDFKRAAAAPPAHRDMQPEAQRVENDMDQLTCRSAGKTNLAGPTPNGQSTTKLLSVGPTLNSVARSSS